MTDPTEEGSALVERATRAQHRQTPLSELMGFNRDFTMVDHEFAWNLAELVKLVESRGGQGHVTLKISVKKEDRGAVMLTFDQAMVPPKNAPAMALAYVGDGGSLHREDPYQINADELGWDVRVGDDRPLTDHEGAEIVTDASGVVARPGERGEPVAVDPEAPYGRDPRTGEPDDKF